MPTPSLVSVGYEGHTIDEVVANLERERVTVLVDVRLTPLSRKPGFSKHRLAAALGAAGIRYLHLRALGNPKENRAALRAGDPASYATFRRHLDHSDARDALSTVAGLMGAERVALLCFERAYETCHRRLVAAELMRREPRLAIVQL